MKPIVHKLFSITFFALLCVLPNLAHAQDSARAQKNSADDQCGYDRRCRIDRLKRLNSANRRATILDEERRVANYAADFNKKHIDESPRVNKPFGLAISYTRLGAGYLLGYNFTGSLRLETSLIIHEDWVYNDGDNNGIYIDGEQDALFWNIAGTYFFSTSWFSPYVSGAVIAGWGDFSSGGYYYDGWTDWGGSTGSGNSSRDAKIHTKYHMVSASAGFDVQLAIGLQARLGFEYGYILYNQARYSAGNYDAEVRKGLNHWMNQSTLWGPQFHIGWAF